MLRAGYISSDISILTHTTDLKVCISSFEISIVGARHMGIMMEPSMMSVLLSVLSLRGAHTARTEEVQSCKWTLNTQVRSG